MGEIAPLVRSKGPTLVFGGPYSNFQATEAVLAEARRLMIPHERVICTGDMVAYCGDPVATIDLVRDSGIHTVMGNCDEQLAVGAENCGCGFPSDSLCERLSAVWFTYATSVLRTDQRAWLASFPRRIDLDIGGKRLAVIHGSVRVINRFVFATTPVGVKREEIAISACDGVIGGHCGLPFTEVVEGKLWHNPGVVGMPANDGTPRIWFSLLTPSKTGLKIEHRTIAYDHATAAKAMQDAGLPPEYRLALASGLWPSCDVLPAREAEAQGVPLSAGSIAWQPKARASRADAEAHETRLLWPTLLSGGGKSAAAPHDRSASAAYCKPSNASATRS
jgi:predicted phosphodiesterase